MTEHIRWYAPCDNCDVIVSIDGDGKKVPDPGEWEQFPQCPLCGDSLSFDGENESQWNRESRLMRNAAERAVKKLQQDILACAEHYDAADGALNADVVVSDLRILAGANTTEPSLPEGLCANKEDHVPHLVVRGSLAPYRCHADQTRRQPFAGEREQRKKQ